MPNITSIFIYIIIYVNIDIFLRFYIISFLTATLQHCNALLKFFTPITFGGLDNYC